MSSWIPGLKWFQRWRGARPIPMVDQNQAPLIFQPTFRLVKWEGYRESHTAEVCRCPHLAESGQGFHSEVRPDGLVYEGVHFHSCGEALENQSFAAWYAEEGNKEIVDASQLAIRLPQYLEGEDPPRAPYGFLLHEHAHEMTNAEIHKFRRDAEIPSRFTVGRSP